MRILSVGLVRASDDSCNNAAGRGGARGGGAGRVRAPAGRLRLLRQRGDELIPDRYVRRGLASWYGDAFDGKPTASGEPFDSNQFTPAHYDLPFDSRVRGRNLNNDREVELRVNDRVPLEALKKGRSRAPAADGDAVAVAVSAVRLPEDPDLSRAPGTPDECRTDLSAVAPGGPASGQFLSEDGDTTGSSVTAIFPGEATTFRQKSRVPEFFALVSDLHRWRTCPVH